MRTLLLAVVSASATAARHQVSSLPGFDGNLPTRHFTGFVEVAKGTSLFYYVVESATNPASDPIVWWQNGGPGASSLAGLFSENGPLLLNASKKLTRNPWAWNLRANLLYVEFGPGIGFSFCGNSSNTTGPCQQARSDCSPCFATDSSVAEQSAIFLRKWREEFVEWTANPLYLAGESYAGVYVPTLAAVLLKVKGANLRGLWVTDPCTDNKAQFGWLDLSVDYAWQKGLIDAPTKARLASCTSAYTPVGDRVRVTGSSACRHAWRLYDLATAGIGDAVHAAAIPQLPLYIDPLNTLGWSGGPDLEGYLGRADVRAALGAQYPADTPNKVYHAELDNNGYPQYTSEYAACNIKAASGAPSMVDVYRKLLKPQPSLMTPQSLMTVIVSSGDMDPVVDIHGTEAAVAKVGFPPAADSARRPWFYNATGTPLNAIGATPAGWGPLLHAHGIGPQLGGFTTGYDLPAGSPSLTFVSVRGSGHMVPAYAPQQALHVLHHLLLGASPLAPPLPSGWDESSDEQFYARGGDKAGLFAKWVASARAAPFV